MNSWPRFREEYSAISRDAGGTAPKIVNAPTGALPAVPQLAELSANLKFVDAAVTFLQRLAPPYHCTLGFVCHPPDSFGAGLTVTQTGHTGRIQSTVLLREKSFNPDALPQPGPADGRRYDGLAMGATAWAFYELSKERLTVDNAPLGTTMWTSYALFRAGAVASRAGQAERARRLFSNA